jgi:ATP-dependent helicase HrpA
MSEQSNKPSPQPARAASRNTPAADQRKPRPEGEARRPRPPRDAARTPEVRTPPVRNPIPPISFPEDLPVSGRRAEIAKAVSENQVVIVSGRTCYGNTTHLPKNSL